MDCRSPEPRPIISMSWTMWLARSPCERMRSRLSVRSDEISWISSRSSALKVSPPSSRISLSSSMSSPETSEKFLTKFSGFLISWATPAVSSPRAASFCCETIWSCAR